MWKKKGNSSLFILLTLLINSIRPSCYPNCSFT